MRRGRTLIILAIVLIGVLILAAVFLPRLVNLFRPAAPTATVYQVYYPLQNIAQGTIITEDDLGTYSLPETSFAQVMFTVDEKASLIGQKAKIAIDQGVPITTGMIVSPDAGLESGGPSWGNLIAAGKTAITIPISRLGSVGYGIADGAHVNVIACMLMIDVDPSYQTELPNYLSAMTIPANVPPDKMPGITVSVNNSGVAPQIPPYLGRLEASAYEGNALHVVPSELQRPRSVCQMVMQDIAVLKLGNFPVDTVQAAGNEAAETQQAAQQQAAASKVPDIVTLIVSPQEAVELTYMVYSNIPLYLTLRNSADTTRYDTVSATLQFLLSQHNITVPVKLAYSLTPRLDALSLPFLPNDIVTVTTQE